MRWGAPVSLVLLVGFPMGWPAARPSAASTTDPGPLDGVSRAQDEIDARLAELDAADPLTFAAAFEDLRRRGAAAALRALDGFESKGFAARRARARLLVELAEPESIRGALALVADLDHVVRATLAELFGELVLARELDGERVATLVSLATDDVDRRVRLAALDALARAELEGTAAALDELIDRADPIDAPDVARAFVQLSSGRVRLVSRVRACFASEAPVDAATLAPLLAGYGRALAELSRGGADRPERVPFVAGTVHPAREVRIAAASALRGFLARLFEFAEHERADAVLAALADEGLPRHDLLYQRATRALAGSGDARAALERATELEHAATLAPADEAAIFRFYALQLQGAAQFALGELGGAAKSFGAAESYIRELLRERLDLTESGLTRVGGALMVDRLQLLALVRVWRALTLLAQGMQSSDPTVLEIVRSAHETLLRAAVLTARTDADSLGSVSTIDSLFERDLAPGPLVLFSGKVERWNAGRGLALLAAMGSALATVAPWEVAGFEPSSEWLDPLRDPPRLELMRRFRAEQEGKLRRDLNRAAPDGATQTLLRNGLFALHQAEREEERRMDEAGDLDRLTIERRVEVFEDLVARTSSLSLYGLTLATHFRTHGRSKEAREIGQRMLEQLFRGLPGANSLSTEWANARVELMIGSAYMDDDLAEEAERVSLSAVRRLEELENTFENQGTDPTTEGTVNLLRAWRATALLSLAVNANVRQGDTERALEYFERAFELDQRDFMQVLRACYRARSGRVGEARTVLRNIQPAPQLYYNLACTYALLGEPREAVDYLRREFDENHPTPGSLQRQKEWARSDPDLAGLRDDPAFRRLVELDDGR